jgi:hypothetical protein
MSGTEPPTIRLRYTGPETREFLEAGTLEQNDEFEVGLARLRAFMRRPDIEHAGNCPAPPCMCGDEPAGEPETAGDAGTAPDGDGEDSDGEDAEEPPGPPGGAGSEDADDPGTAESERTVVKPKRKRARSTGPGTGEAAAGDTGGAEEG